MAKNSRSFAALLVGTGALSAVSLIFPFVFMYAVFMIVPGVLMAAANAIFPYLLALLPVFAPIRGPRAKFLKVLACLVTVTAVAVLPAIVGQQGFAAFVAKNAREEISLPRAVGPITTLQIKSDEQPKCKDLCQRLLYGGHVKTVIVSYWKQAKSYTIEHWSRCPADSYGPPKRMLAGECLIAVDGAYQPADVVVENKAVIDHYSDELKALEPSLKNRLRLWVVKAIDRDTVIERTSAGAKTVERSTHIDGAVASAPFVIFFNVKGANQLGPQIMRSRREISPGGLEDILRRRYSWQLAPVAEKPNSHATSL